ncbi:helix-turn-helix domain-containing protein, partial [candidate division KSB1 bacterium]|nr:helix-turn-helix transcriptional regulator [Phycisphaerae bacterium]NIV94924.1 helix-turn-helix domain-containing protein [candidate division KSB1 bacterium]
GKWLFEQRRARDLTRQDLAFCVGCSVSALRKIETDERRPSRQLAELLAGCLEIPPEYQRLFVETARGLSPVDRLGR